jgi:alpha-glucosidase
LYTPLGVNGDLLLFFRERRDERLLIALNMGSQPISVSLAVSGSVLLSSFADREAETIKNAIKLRGNEGLVVRVDLWATGGT